MLAGIAAVTAAVATGCSDSGSEKSAPSASPVRAVDPHTTQSFGDARGPLLLQVLAHPDDDLFFMNPDALHMVRAGVPVVSVYVTAGEAIGQNWVEGMPRKERQHHDKAAYSSARHQGLRQAYARMLGKHPFTPWQKSVLSLPGGVKAETNELVAGNRRARLVFLNVAMLSEHSVRLPQLWDQPGAEAKSLVAKGSPCTEVSTYRHSTLVDALATIMDRFRPTVVHTMDPDPDYQVHDATHPKDNDYGACSDHRDHTPTALFTWKALSQWSADTTRREKHPPRFVTTSYRGYYNQRWPHNLPHEIVAQKHELVEAYGGAPDWHCGNDGGCGDYGQGGDRPLKNRKGWIRSTHYRHPGATPTVDSDRSGRLEAYGVLGLHAVRWRETSAGSGRWGAPENLGGGPLAPALTTVKDADGRRLVFALRFSALEGEGRADTREIVVLAQRTPDGPFTGWTGLGNPEHSADRGRRVGVPVAVTDPDGRVHLFVRNAGKGVSTRVRERDGKWGKWRNLGGQDVQEGLTVALDGDRRIHVLGVGRDTVHHWSQDGPGKPMRFLPLDGLPKPAGDPVAAHPGDDGKLVVVYRQPAQSRPQAFRLTGDAGTEELKDSAVRDLVGYGPLTARALPQRGHRDALMVLGKDLEGRAQVLDAASDDAHPTVADRQPVPVATPALHTDGAHRLCVVGLAPDATPWIWRPDLG
ncbi:PIG-L family deacetylase [Streptomyces mobaraensis]|uniref:PIG-L family deacetylase n=1 Tax=Streptomyces mobaraensis TaxID=35621 RepID=A0A5N5W3G2_STRMB|nr:PIG-L family deacetylase [Streptomyces mobaraensis]